MFILCDTSSILLLLRIAPDMFIDAGYECCTIQEIHNELIRTTKFKTKYPWIRDMRSKLKPLMLTEEQKKTEKIYFEAIHFLQRNGIVNTKTDRFMWKTLREAAQPPKAISDFKKLTKWPYPAL